MNVKEILMKSDLDESKQLGILGISTLSSILKVAKDGASFGDIKIILLEIENVNSTLWGLMALAGDMNNGNHPELYKRLNNQLDETIARYRDILEYVIKESRDLHDKH